ncbi:MAG: hydrogenase maturation protease [Planctomycetota bacterium]|nr:MAG: hydrogenase maturation protease [Planctomycetota bacterium]
MPTEHPAEMRTLVLGLGNPILSDDSVGLRVVDRLRSVLADQPHIEVDEDHWGGLRLMEHLAGYDRAVIVDAMQLGHPPGTIIELTPDGLPTQRSCSSHDVTFATALELGRKLNIHLPPDEFISLVGIEADDILTFGESCTPAVEAAIPQAVEFVLAILKRWNLLPAAAQQDDASPPCCKGTPD